MNEIISLTNIDWKVFIISFAVFIAAVIAITKSFDYIMDRFGIETKRMREVKEQKEDIQELKKQLSEYQDQRKADMKKSEESDEEIKQALITLTKDVGKLQEMVLESRQHENDARIAQLKDRIGESYRYYHSKQQWSHMEKEALEGLIASYKRSGGNSFVHNIVEPEMPTWKIVD